MAFHTIKNFFIQNNSFISNDERLLLDIHRNRNIQLHWLIHKCRRNNVISEQRREHNTERNTCSKQCPPAFSYFCARSKRYGNGGRRACALGEDGYPARGIDTPPASASARGVVKPALSRISGDGGSSAQKSQRALLYHTLTCFHWPRCAFRTHRTYTHAGGRLTLAGVSLFFSNTSRSKERKRESDFENNIRRERARETAARPNLKSWERKRASTYRCVDRHTQILYAPRRKYVRVTKYPCTEHLMHRWTTSFLTATENTLFFRSRVQ